MLLIVLHPNLERIFSDHANIYSAVVIEPALLTSQPVTRPPRHRGRQLALLSGHKDR